MTDLLPDYILFAVGLALLLGSAELLVRNASKLASRIGKSSLFIGLTVTAFGTSAPELAVGISGQLSQNSDVGLGNIVGSNIFNILFVLGLAAVIRPIVVRRPLVWRDVPILLIVTVLFLLFALNGTVGSVESAVLVSVLAIYLYYLSKQSNERPGISIKSSPGTATEGASSRLSVSLFLIAASIAIMVIGAHLVITGAVRIAGGLGVSELVSGLTIVAIGTSLPEIMTTIAAVRNNEHELAIGNVMGSCFFNIVAVPAVMSLIGTAGLSISSDALTVDIPVMILAVVACLPIFFSGHRISRSEGVLFLVYCSAYFTLLYTRSASDSFTSQYLTEIGILASIAVSFTFVTIAVRAMQYHKHQKEKTGP